jgi:hypothetical protein
MSPLMITWMGRRNALGLHIGPSVCGSVRNSEVGFGESGQPPDSDAARRRVHLPRVRKCPYAINRIQAPGQRG